MKNVFNILSRTPYERVEPLSDRPLDEFCGKFYGQMGRDDTEHGFGDGDGYTYPMQNGYCDSGGRSFGRGCIINAGCCSDEGDANAWGSGDGEYNIDGTCCP
jgi:hypothetical protein